MDAGGETITVAKDGSGNYTTIQEAIDNASERDRVWVYEGEYHENIVVDKWIVVRGNYSMETKLIGNGSGDVITVIGDNAGIGYFDISNGSNGVAVRADNVWVYDNNFTGNRNAISLLNVTNCTVRENNLMNNTMGIIFNGSNDSLVYWNILFSNDVGLELRNTSNTWVLYNNFTGHKTAILINGSHTNDIQENYVFNGTTGVDVSNSWYNAIYQGIISGNDRGISIENSSDIRIAILSIMNNEIGLFQDDESYGNFAVQNTIIGNSNYAVQNENTSHFFNATQNWWGVLSGPYHPDANPDGEGDEVSDYVDFSSWDTNDRYVSYVDDDAVGGGNGSIAHPFQTIQEGLDDVLEGGTVYVFNGTYQESVMVEKEVTIIGNGSDTTFLDAASSANGFFLAAHNVTISGFTIIGGDNGVFMDGTNFSSISGLVLESDTYGVEVQNSENCSISSLFISSQSCGLFIENSANISIEDVLTSNNSVGVRISQSQDISLSDGSSFNHSSYGVEAINTDGLTILNWNCSENRYSGIRLQSTSGVIIRQCEINDGGNGIEVYRVQNAIIIDNTFLNASSNCIDMESNNNNNIRIESNLIYGRLTAIFIRGTNVTLTSNTLVGCIIRSDANNFDQAKETMVITNTNTVNGQYVYFRFGASNRVIDYPVGQIILVNCTDMTIREQTFTDIPLPIYISSCNNILIHDINVQNASINGILMEQSTSCTIRDVLCNGTGQYGIVLYKVNESELTDVQCTDFGFGIYVQDAINVTMEQLVCTNNTGHGLYAQEGVNIAILSSDFSNNGNCGLSTSSEDSIISNCNTSFNFQNGIYLYSAYRTRVTQCRVWNNTNEGIEVYSSFDRIDNNSVFNNTLAGIYLRSESDLNFFQNNTIEDNHCWNNGNSGIAVLRNRNNILSRNLCDNNEFNGIHLVYTSNNILRDCIVTLNLGDGLSIAAGAWQNEIWNLTSFNNEWAGVNISDSSQNQIYLSTITDHTTGVNIFDDSRDITIDSCTISDCFDGVYVWTPYTRIRITNSTIVGNYNRGVRVPNPDSSTVKAMDNWWGASTGPYHYELNPIGEGDPISRNIDFGPWLMFPPDYTPPTSHIVSIDPNETVEGETVTMIGDFQIYGPLVEVKWESTIDGDLDWTSPNPFTSGSLSPGRHGILFSVQDSYGLWSEIDTWILTIHPIPVAIIQDISTPFATQGEAITFIGKGAEEQQTSEYEWKSNRDGIISDQASFQTTTLSNGTHIISFRVRDELGFWSQTVTSTITINGLPSARIVLIYPEEASLGNVVQFDGRGSDDGDVVRYAWTSDIDGEFSNGSKDLVYIDTLSAGEHRITLRVQDDSGAWSNAADSSITINELITKDKEDGFNYWIILILIVVGVSVYFILFKGGGSDGELEASNDESEEDIERSDDDNDGSGESSIPRLREVSGGYAREREEEGGEQGEDVEEEVAGGKGKADGYPKEPEDEEADEGEDNEIPSYAPPIISDDVPNDDPDNYEEDHDETPPWMDQAGINYKYLHEAYLEKHPELDNDEPVTITDVEEPVKVTDDGGEANFDDEMNDVDETDFEDGMSDGGETDFDDEMNDVDETDFDDEMNDADDADIGIGEPETDVDGTDTEIDEFDTGMEGTDDDSEDGEITPYFDSEEESPDDDSNTTPPSPPSDPYRTGSCPTCNSEFSYLATAQKWFCQTCKKFVQPVENND